MNHNLTDMLGSIAPEDWLDYEAIDYRHLRGSSGEQLNLQRCPFCEDDRWKVYLNAESGLGNCFHCNQKFNMFKVIKAHTGLIRGNLTAYIEQVAKSVGWLPKEPRQDTATEEGGEWEMPTSLSIPIHGQYNLQYLEDRGVSGSVAHDFGLRYCEQGCYRYQDRVQDYAGRIIIPICDLDGTLTAFQGRDTTGEADQKYLFPSGLPSSGKLLYNGNNVIGKTHVVVGEGVFDAIAIQMAVNRIPNVGAVATFGMHLSAGDPDANDQLGRFCSLRNQGLKRVTLMWDSEKQALKEALKAARLLKSVSLDTYIARLPQGCDPNEVEPNVVRRAIIEAVQFNSLNEIKLRGLCNS